MNKITLLFGAFILSAVFLFGCSSTDCDCDSDKSLACSNSSSSVKQSPSSSSESPPIENQKLTRKTITLSLDSSYADIDNPTVYTKEGAANNLDKIDLVAYCGADCKNNSIYNPYEIMDLFWDPTYIGADIYLFEIPDTQAEIFKTATKLSEIVKPLNILIDTFNGTSGVKEISIAVGKTFLVYTPDEIRVVIIKGTGNKSVDLEILLIPSN